MDSSRPTATSPGSVAILGTGLMGAQIAAEYALGGWSVTCLSRHPLAAEARVEEALGLVRRERLAAAEALHEAPARIDFRTAEDELGPCELIVESLPEDLGLKSDVLGAVASRQPRALIATNTSSISIPELAAAASVAGRIVGTHYWNPPLLMPLVEIVAAEGTPGDRLDLVEAILAGLGKRPVRLRREVPGLLWNRLQAAVLRECLWLVEQGAASPQALDEVMRDGLARRWRLTGPFETVGLGGASTFDAIARNLFPALSDAASCEGFGAYVPTEPAELRALRERRDEALARLLREERGIEP
ncbi:MAG: 3-hydroxyacyl-CoA dehydrogenase family protein [Syntrophothermus sp.]